MPRMTPEERRQALDREAELSRLITRRERREDLALRVVLAVVLVLWIAFAFVVATR